MADDLKTRVERRAAEIAAWEQRERMSRWTIYAAYWIWIGIVYAILF